MPRTYYLADGSPSFDGLNPKFKVFGGYQFGYHGETQKCAGENCPNWTHYSLHKRYKFTVNLEKMSGKWDYKHGVSRLYICSNECFQNLILANMIDLPIPGEVAEKILCS